MVILVMVVYLLSNFLEKNTCKCVPTLINSTSKIHLQNLISSVTILALIFDTR